MKMLALKNKITFLRKNPYILLILCAFIIIIASLGIPLKDFVGGCGSDDSSEEMAAEMAERDEIERIMSSETEEEAEKLEAIKSLVASGANRCTVAQTTVTAGYEAVEVISESRVASEALVRAGGKEFLFGNAGPFPTVTLQGGIALSTQPSEFKFFVDGALFGLNWVNPIVRKACPTIARIYSFAHSSISPRGWIYAYTDIEANGKVTIEFRTLFPLQRVTGFQYKFYIPNEIAQYIFHGVRYDTPSLRFVRSDESTMEEIQGRREISTLPESGVFMFGNRNVAVGLMRGISNIRTGAGNPLIVIDNSSPTGATVTITPFEAPANTLGGGFSLRDTISFLVEEEAPSGLPTPAELDQLILTNWRNQRQRLTNYVGETFSTDGLSLARNYSLYAIQGETNALLRYAAKRRNIELLSELADLYLAPIQHLETVWEYTYHYLTEMIPTPADIERLGHTPAWYPYYNSTLPLNEPRRIWRDNNQSIGESTLNVGQFLFVVSEAYIFFLGIPRGERPQSMVRFLDEYASILKEYYFIHMYDDNRLYGIKGWECQPIDAPETNGYDYLNKLLNFEFRATNGEPRAHCNYYGDVEMWLASGVANFLRADSIAVANGWHALLTPDEKQRALAYVDLATRVMISRTTESLLTNFEGRQVTGYNFGIEHGLQDHPSFAYACNTGANFPDHEQPCETLGWDISHASRFVYALTALNNALGDTGQIRPSREDLSKFASQFAYGTFRKDSGSGPGSGLLRPLFNNYVDGTNGWFLVNRELGSGTPPYGSSLSGPAGGWGQWYEYSRDISKIMSSIWKVSRLTDIPDLSGGGRYASLGHRVSITADGKVGKGAIIQSNASDTPPSIDCGTYTEFISPTGSFEAWIKFDNGQQDFFQDIFRIYQVGEAEFRIARIADGRIWVYIRNSNSGTIYVNNYTRSVITDTAWHHIVVAQDGGGIDVFIDGNSIEMDMSGTSPGTWTNILDMSDPKAGCALGHSGYVMVGNGFSGSMDEVRIYNAGLSSEEVRRHFNGTFSENDNRLVAHWDFNSGDNELINFRWNYYGDPQYTNFVKREPVDYFKLKDSVIMLQFLCSIVDIVDDQAN